MNQLFLLHRSKITHKTAKAPGTLENPVPGKAASSYPDALSSHPRGFGAPASGTAERGRAGRSEARKALKARRARANTHLTESKKRLRTD